MIMPGNPIQRRLGPNVSPPPFAAGLPAPGPARLPKPGESNPTADYMMGRGQAFNQYGAGAKRYGISGAPNIGPVADKTGYVERDVNAQRLRNAALRKLQQGQLGNQMNPDVLRG